MTLRPNILSTCSLAVLACTLLFPASGFAADMPVKAAPPPPAPMAPYSWTGFYIGAHIGGGWSDTDWEHHHHDVTHVFAADGSGFLGGLQGGFNYQFAPNWLIGLEGQFSWTGIDGDGQLIENGEPHTVSFDVNWIGTLGPRLGYVWGNGFVYAKGGVAWADFDYGHTHQLLAGPLHTFNGGDTQTGWFVGGGVEYALWSQFSAKVEYNFINLGSENVTLSGPPGTVSFDVDHEIHVVKAGINYRFGAPAVAPPY